MMRWIMVAPIAAMMSVQAEAAITLEQLQQQAAVVQAASLQYRMAQDGLTELESQKQAAFNRWQSLSSLSALYYGAGYYERGDYYQSAAVLDQAEYDRLSAVILIKRENLEAVWQTYLREYASLQAMLDAYRLQGG